MKVSEEILRLYLDYLDLSAKSDLLFVTTNDLATMSFCLNKVYLQVNFLGGVSEYEYRRLKENDKDSIRSRFERKTKWRLTEDALETYFIQELRSLSRIPASLESFPLTIPEFLELTIPEKNGFFHSEFRINFGLGNFFISAVPDVVIIRDGEIKGIIEIKSTRKALREIYPSEYRQVDFYKYYVMKRKLPLSTDAYFFTLKGVSDTPEDLENEVVNLLQKEEPSKEALHSFASKHNYILKESTEDIKKIEKELTERINVLSSESIPTKYCRCKLCSFREFCEKLECCKMRDATPNR